MLNDLIGRIRRRSRAGAGVCHEIHESRESDGCGAASLAMHDAFSLAIN